MKFRVTFLTMIFPLCVMTGCQSMDYSKAQKAYDNGEYAEAVSIFESLGDYKDSSELALESKYDEANAAMESEDYETASKLYEDLEDYEDSLQLYIECQYHLGENAYNDEKWDDAISYLEDLDYSPEKGSTATELLMLSKAQKAFSDSDYKTVLKALDTYPDKEKESIYNEAAYNLFSDELSKANSSYNQEAAVAAICDKGLLADDKDKILEDLKDAFTDLIDSEKYDAFPYMDAIIDRIEDDYDTTELKKMVDDAYVQRVTAFLVGKWQRDDDTALSGAILEVLKADDGTLTGVLRDLSNVSNPDVVYFKENDIKWKEIKICSDSEFIFEDMWMSNDMDTGETLTVEYTSTDAKIDYENERLTFHSAPKTTTADGYYIASSWGDDQEWVKQ